MNDSLYDIPLKALDGRALTLGEFRGQVLLLVNVASKCGLTPQYAELETLFKQYRERGLRVLGFPCNDFAAQEPGSAGEIQHDKLWRRFPDVREAEHQQRTAPPALRPTHRRPA